MPVGSCGSLLNLSAQCTTKQRIIPLIESRAQLVRLLDSRHEGAFLLRHCNLFEIAGLLERAQQRGLTTYISVDHIDGIHADSAGLQYLAHQMHVIGVVSSHPRTLSLAKEYGLETIQRIFALDSTGSEAALASVDVEVVDLLDISPALVVPHLIAQRQVSFVRPFIASGLIHTPQQMHALLGTGAAGVVVARDDLWL